jgi:hypothetical protein
MHCNRIIDADLVLSNKRLYSSFIEWTAYLAAHRRRDVI